ncbi:MAG: 4Fe-4S binding protein, partial [Bacteroidetes bacterium]|nr:4Fe-4S binding protein [Bacteroidota bacterium]
MKPKNIPLVRTIEERCKTCYTCVRECPAKAIKIQNGQAMVIEKRCIGCGNCVKVCSQGAKVYYKSKDAIISLLNSTDHIVAAIAPSFAAEFSEYEDHKIIVGMIKALGFKEVFEVAFGADIVADRYNKLFSGNKKEHYISSDCPAIVNYIEKYYPHLVKHLVPVVSPMIATARIIKHIYGNDLKIVFIGPCIAKKDESDEVEEVLTFTELRSLLAERNITSANSEPSDFNEPVG